jgi:hypothetical protein
MDHQPPNDPSDEFEMSPEAWPGAPPQPPEAPPGPDPDPGFYQRALHRMPRWIALVTLAGLPVVGWRFGSTGAASFIVGAIGGYWNYIAVCRIADRLSQTVEQTGQAPRSGPRGLLRLMFIAVAAFVIIRFTHINLAAAFLGLFTPVAAVLLEILYELVSRKS